MWQTPASVKIYARMSSDHYALLLGRAMKARVSTARAQALSHAMPFLHQRPPKPTGDGERRDEQTDGERVETELAAMSEETSAAEAGTGKRAKSYTARKPATSTRKRGRAAAKPASKQKRKAPKQPEKKTMRQAEGKGVARDADWVKRYGEVIYYPSDIDEHEGFLDRPVRRKPPTERRLA